MPDFKINARQMMLLVILFTIGSSILVTPSGQAYFSKQDGWIASIVGSAAGFLIIWMYTIVGNLDPSKNLFQLNDLILGKWLGRTVSLVIVVTLISQAPSSLLYYLGNFTATHLLPVTPIEAINILFAFIAVLGVRLGLWVLALSAEVLFPLFITIYFILVISISPQIKWDHVQPILENGVQPLWPAILTFSSIGVLPLVFLLAIYPSSINQITKARRTLTIGYIVGSLFICSIVFLCIAVIGEDLTARKTYPGYFLAQKINVGHFFQRIEASMAFMWIISLYFKLALFLYVTCIGLAHVFGLKDYRTLVLPLGLLSVTLSLIIFPDIVYNFNWDTYTWVPLSILFGVLYPLLLLGIAFVRKYFPA